MPASTYRPDLSPQASARIANACMATVFASFAGVQWNDPDPLTWMAIYSAAAGVCLLLAFAMCHVLLPATVCVVAALWALSLVPKVAAGAQVEDLARSMQVMRPEIEELRELGGLLIVAAWMAWHWARLARQRPESARGRQSASHVAK